MTTTPNSSKTNKPPQQPERVSLRAIRKEQRNSEDLRDPSFLRFLATLSKWISRILLVLLLIAGIVITYKWIMREKQNLQPRTRPPAAKRALPAQPPPPSPPPSR